MVKSVSTPPESGVDALKVVLTHLVCQHLLESGVDARQQLKKVVLTQLCQQCVNVETQPLRQVPCDQQHTVAGGRGRAPRLTVGRSTEGAGREPSVEYYTHFTNPTYLP